MIKIKHLIKPRQFGKTYDCITESAKTGAIIVTRDVNMARYIKEMAEKRGLSIPDPMSFRQIINVNNGIGPKEIDLSDAHFIVDDADMVLYQLLGCHPIDTISMVSRDHNGQEEMLGITRALMGLEPEDCDIKPHLGFTEGTYITMADATSKKIEDIQVGDVVLGIPKDIKDFKVPIVINDHPYHCLDNYIPSKVSAINTHSVETIDVWYNHGGENESFFRVANGQKFLTYNGNYKTIQDIIEEKVGYIYIVTSQRARRGLHSTQIDYYELELKPGKVEIVYSLKTETGTYIANGGVVSSYE